MSRQTISLLVLAAVLAILLLLVPDVLLTVFAGILLAVFLQGGGHWLAARLGLADGWGVGLFLLCIVVALVVFGLAVAPAIGAQVDELTRRIPQAFETLRDRLADYSWGSAVLDRLSPEALASSESRSAALTAVSSTFGALGNAVIILFIGLYGALDPGVYRKGLTLLLAPSIRRRGDEILRATAATLRNWLTAQLMAMTVVGVLTAFGLWFAGVPLAFALGLLAGLLAFIPNIGPVLAIAPALLLALPDGLSMVLIVLAIYLGVQALESYVVTPLIQQEKVSLPPALVISAQLLFGVLFGILGLALATPIAAALMTIVGLAYVEDYLGRESPAETADARK
ncbi:AI-2E family transporter [Aquibium microcysteis]|uniref:AI-2E family transporter n=1 Tax=Aquibium microcysteis TaxID=675281 RepID=UPI00165CF144|nr:AI-2E family transporter [Aquibium microcysteis]